MEDYMDLTDSSNKLNIEKNKMKIVVKYAEKMINDMKTTENSADSSDESEDKNPPYPMQGSKPGVALVINNINFENKNIGEQLDERKGADVDTENLEELFNQMGFKWIYWENQTKKQINNKLKEFTSDSNQLLKEVDSCFVFVMSHGGQGTVPEDTHIYTYDNQIIKANDIIRRFNSSDCKLLQGKPKFLIFQACRGELKDLALNKQPIVGTLGVAESGSSSNNQTHAVESDDTSTSSIIETSIAKIPSMSDRDDLKDLALKKQPIVGTLGVAESGSSSNIQTHAVESDDTSTSSIIETSITTIPSMSDMFIYYTTSPGFISFRDPSKGTWFVQYFCEIFMNHVYNTDVLDLFGMITRKVLKQKTDEHALQVPHSAIRGKFQPCFLYPSLKTIDDNQETNDILLNLAKEFEEKNEIARIENELKKFV